MNLTWPQDEPTLLLPVQNGAEQTPIAFLADGKPIATRRFPLACDRIDGWFPVERSWLPDAQNLEVQLDDAAAMGRAATFSRQEENPYRNALPLVLHGGQKRARLEKTDNGWRLTYHGALLGQGEDGEKITLKSQDLIFWQRAGVDSCVLPPEGEPHTGPGIWRGDIDEVLHAQDGEGPVTLAFLKRPGAHTVGRDLLSEPVRLVDGRPVFDPHTRHYRIFERRFAEVDAPFRRALTFRVAPDVWPDIRLLPAEGIPGDISADAFELKASLTLENDAEAELSIGGHTLTVSLAALCCGGQTLPPVREGENTVTLHLFATEDFLQVAGEAGVLVAARGAGPETAQTRVVPITENIAHCSVEPRREQEVSFRVSRGRVHVNYVNVFGLRLPQWSSEAALLLERHPGKGELVYKTSHYRVFKHCVEDDRYGPPAAFAPSGGLVLSPQRVCEEFTWRKNDFGDMVRSVNRTDIWRPSFAPGQYPALHSGVASVDAAYNIALDTFFLNADRRFTLPGQENMWSGGLFQGEGQSFGVWLRDSAHVAMRCGSLIDAPHARRTLLYTTKQGFDNGSDGPAMAIVGLWDYYLATGDAGALYEAWPALMEKAETIDGLYREEDGLVLSPMSTSNDCFDEPENGGYALGGESYYMLAYECMAKIGALVGHEGTDTARWQRRADAVRQAIQARYWNSEYGYFTSGPKGSDAFTRGLWETAGVESAVWSRFGLASEEQKQTVLEKLRTAALCEYGIVLYPYKEKVNHFTGSVWGVWQAGFADAAAATGDVALVEQLVYGQVRNILLNKTFYEVIDAESGIAWRWPGQLWHAAGFVSLLYYGVLGIQYDENGLLFKPAVPASMPRLELRGLHYQKAVLDITLEGAGTGHKLQLDGEAVPCIPFGVEGHHRVALVR